MKIIDPAEVKKIKEARELVKDLQLRLIDCERRLDDIARCAEICMVTNQFHLLGSFVDAANEYLQDRLDLIELSESNPVNTPNIRIIEDELSTQST